MSSQNSANLTIKEASVTALGSQDGGSGVRLITSQTGSPSLTIEVKGGSLQASGETNGIHFLSNVNDATAVANMKVSGNAMVKASNIITTKDGTGSAPELKPAASGSDGTGGIIWDGKSGTVYGDVTLQEDITIGEGESLTLDDGASLNAGNHNVIVDDGTLDENLANSLGDSVKYAPAITNHPKNVEVKEKETATFTVEATGSDLSYQWQQSTDNGSKWTNITGETNTTYTIATTTMDMNGTQYRCVVENNIGKVTSDAATLTVQKATTPIEPKYVRYIVEHYKQNADGSYTLADTEQPIDEIGKTVTATPKTYAGYTYNPNAAGTVASGTLIAISNPDDIVTLKLYYDRTAYPVTVETDGNGTAFASPASAPEETLITLTAVLNSGYHFDRWEVVSGDITITNNTFTMPAEPVTVKAVFDRDSSGGAHHPDAGSTTTTSSDRYEIETPSDVENGSVKASASKAEKGDTVTVTVTPDDGYALDKLAVYDEDGDKLDLNDKGDGKFTFQMPKGDVSIEVSFAPIEDETPKADFSDVPADAWSAEAVQYVYENGLMTGTSDTTFSPDLTTSRSMIATILWRMAGSPVVNYAMDFADVPADQWYAEAVRWASSEGIVGGYGNGFFGTGHPITREQFAVMLYRFAQKQGYDVSVGENTNILSYTDVSSVSEYAIPAMQWAVGSGVITGTGDTLAPQGETTRAQAAMMLMRFSEQYA